MKLWNNLKISQRIFYSFVVILASTVALSLVIFGGLGGISQSYERLLERDHYKTYLNDFMNSINVAERTANSLKRFMTEGKMSIQPADSLAFKSDMKIILETSENIFPVLQEILPEEIFKFERMINKIEDAITHDFVEDEEKNYSVLLSMSSSLSDLQFFSANLAKKLEEKIDQSILGAEKNIKGLRIAVIILNVLTLVLILLIVLPLLKEVRRVFLPVREAAETAHIQASKAMEYTNSTHNSLKQLRSVQ